MNVVSGYNLEELWLQSGKALALSLGLGFLNYLERENPDY
jgi:hypothetical protein